MTDISELINIILSSNPENYHEAVNKVVSIILREAEKEGKLKNYVTCPDGCCMSEIKHNTVHAKPHDELYHIYPAFPLRYYIEERNPLELCPVCKEYSRKYKNVKIMPLYFELINPKKFKYELGDLIDYNSNTRNLVNVFVDKAVLQHFLKIVADVFDFPELIEYKKFADKVVRFGDYELILERNRITNKIELILYYKSRIVVFIRDDFISIDRAEYIEILKQMYFSEVYDLTNLSRLLV